MKWLTQIFKRNKQLDTLPPEVAGAISAAWVVDRSVDENELRLFFAVSGRPLAAMDRADVVLKKIFPELSEAQLQRAVTFLEDVARLRMREAGNGHGMGCLRRVDTSHDPNSWMGSLRRY